MKKIEEKNKMIAEFMGEKSVYNIKTDIDPMGYYESEKDGKNFHNSWDWLMPVVEKIKDTKSPFNPTEIDGIDFVLSCDLRLENLYNAVCEFIEWYNKYK